LVVLLFDGALSALLKPAFSLKEDLYLKGSAVKSNQYHDNGLQAGLDMM
jgi:hypothetical protein